MPIKDTLRRFYQEKDLVSEEYSNFAAKKRINKDSITYNSWKNKEKDAE